LVESNLLGASEIANGASASLGAAFASGGKQDVVARVGTSNGLLNLAIIEYGATGLLGDFVTDGVLNAADIDALTTEVRAGTNNIAFDLNGDALVDKQDHRVWVKDLRNTWFGDANLDGEFNTADFVAVFQIGEYEDGIAKNSTWSEGDWSGDGDFDSGDFVVAFQDGGFELGQRLVTSVPEPNACGWFAFGLLIVWRRIRR
jgi:hypothetical protein